MLVDALAQGRERRDALRGVPLRCWDARSKVSDYLDDGLPSSDRVLVEGHLEACPTCPPLYAGLVGTRAALGALRDADAVVPPALADRSRRCSPASDRGSRPGRCLRVEGAYVSKVLQLRLHGNRCTGCWTGAQVHRCAGATLDMTASTWLPQPLQVIFPQWRQRAGLHMWCSYG